MLYAILLWQSFIYLICLVGFMNTIDKKLQDSQRWKEAQKALENFKEMMKLVRKYPIKPMQQLPPSPPYTISELYNY